MGAFRGYNINMLITGSMLLIFNFQIGYVNLNEVVADGRGDVCRKKPIKTFVRLTDLHAHCVIVVSNAGS